MSDWSHLLSDWGGQPGFWSYLDVSLQPHGRKNILNWKFQLGEVTAEVSETGLGGEQTPWAELQLLGGLCSSYAHGDRENRNRLETGRGHWC